MWNIYVKENEVTEMQQKFRVINVSFDDTIGKATLRVLSEEKPPYEVKEVSPTLEYYYLYVFGDIE